MDHRVVNKEDKPTNIDYVAAPHKWLNNNNFNHNVAHDLKLRFNVEDIPERVQLLRKY